MAGSKGGDAEAKEPQSSSLCIPMVYEASNADCTSLCSLLGEYAPHGLPLFNRLRSSVRSDSALVLTSFPLSEQPSSPFVIGFFDSKTPDCLPCFLFSSMELPDASSGKAQDEQALLQILALLRHYCVKSPADEQDSSSARFMQARLRGDAAETVNLPDMTFAGCVHSRVADLLRGGDVVRQSGQRVIRDDIHGTGGPYVKLAWQHQPNDEPSSQLEGPDLPEDLTWDSLRGDADVETIMANNSIVRVRSQVDGRPHVALRDTCTGKLAAFACLGLDASVRTLFVETQWRGKGLAKQMIRRLVKQNVGPGDWCHTDVAADNRQSTGLFKHFGAKPIQESYWMRVDTGAAKRALDFALRSETLDSAR